EERVEPYRRREQERAGAGLYARLERWAEWAKHTVTEQWPEMPAGVEDGDANVWEALVAVADAAGGGWPERARVSAVTLVTENRETDPSLGVQLLADLREVFGDKTGMHRDSVLEALNQLEESPWQNLKGHPLDA